MLVPQLPLANFGNLFGVDGIIVLAIGLLIFGRRLPEVGKNLGKTIVEFEKGPQRHLQRRQSGRSEEEPRRNSRRRNAKALASGSRNPRPNATARRRQPETEECKGEPIV